MDSVDDMMNSAGDISDSASEIVGLKNDVIDTAHFSPPVSMPVQQTSRFLHMPLVIFRMILEEVGVSGSVYINPCLTFPLSPGPGAWCPQELFERLPPSFANVSSPIGIPALPDRGIA